MAVRLYEAYYEARCPASCYLYWEKESGRIGCTSQNQSVSIYPEKLLCKFETFSMGRIFSKEDFKGVAKSFIKEAKKSWPN